MCTCVRILTCVCLYVSAFVSVNSWQQIVCVYIFKTCFAVIDTRSIYKFNSTLMMFSHDGR